MTYTHWEAAASASKAGRAVSSVQKRMTPRGELGTVIVIGHRIAAHYAYASADGIAVSATYGRPQARDIDSVREWRVG